MTFTNKTFFLIGFLLVSFYSYAQMCDSCFVFRLDGAYNESTTNNALSYNYNGAKSKNGGVFLSVGRVFKRWGIGAGFEYNRNKTEAIAQFYKPSETTATLLAEDRTVTLNMYGGALYVTHYLPVWRNLYFTPGFYVSYGVIKGDSEGIFISKEKYPTTVLSEPAYQNWTLGSPVFVTGYKQDISMTYFYMQLSPELTWLFSTHFGLNLQMGGFRIDVLDSDWKNSTKQINFNPSFWKLGILFKV